MTGAASPTAVVAVLAPAIGRITVDPLTGAVHLDERGAVLSAADAAALEVALQLGSSWDLPVTAVSAGGTGATTALREALAVGVARAIRVDTADDEEPDRVATLLADTVGTAAGPGAAPLVVAGVHGSDVASAAVPAYLAHRLGAAQALGLISVEPGLPGRCEVVRRLDRGARERLAVTAPAVCSVEGSVARLRRAGLRSVLASDTATIDVVTPDVVTGRARTELLPRPWRPPTQVVAAPDGATALERIRDLTGVAGPARQSRTIEADPATAAEEILAQLGDWGVGPRSSEPRSPETGTPETGTPEGASSEPRSPGE